MEKLYALGFLPSASVENLAADWSITIANNRNATNILYAFIFVSGEGDLSMSRVAYIGHTRKTFENRMRGYQYGNGQAVNHRVHSAIGEHLKQGGRVEVLCLPNTNRMTIHDIPVDVAAGLEYGLISFFARFNRENDLPPLLNIAGNPGQNPGRQRIDDRAEDDIIQGDQAEENMDYVGVKPPQAAGNPPVQPGDGCFDLKLTEQTYWPMGSINIPIRLTKSFGVNGAVVGVDLISNDDNHQHVEAVINRTANPNGAPRLLFQGENGKRYREWKQVNHKPNEVLRICVVESDSITVQ